MSLGTLYVNASPRSIPAKCIIEGLGLDVKIETLASADDKFAAKFPIKKFPTFEGADGFKIHEVVAICQYLINLSDDEEAKKALLGANIKQQALVSMCTSFFNTDSINCLAQAMLMAKGVIPFNKKVFDEKLNTYKYYCSVMDRKLRDCTFLTSEDISLGDIFGAANFGFAFTTMLGKAERKQYPNLVRYVQTVFASPFFKTEGAQLKFIDTALAFVPPKKEKKEKKEQPAADKKEAKQAENAEPAPEKKAKHPLEALGKATFVLDDWKRKYSNEDTRPVALPWFWEHYNPEEYSLWKVEYKYNDELTQTFMSNNLVGGFFNRLSGSIKYMFGSLVVYGVNNDNGIVGAVLVRGQEYAPAFDVAPDWESYSYVKLDASKEEDKAFVNNMWAWDEPVIVNGVAKEIADGKVLK
ncbi:hypothetical protein TPHA_0L01950 [Tetrapisispora phaffii CBS 4417]|uniref:Elongation factor 1-gamma 1 n=1 Tax=Tetrapisispora phaffii (strain ATCC 24235 / CBS 4417 / NBRC 1672 / NRRL Y-8282 / UCD 70-5) TaxID=1071381 RepID=G8C069_TETPH|nr:elongation factor 1 gamma domain-containing protein TPHA_0L01950 [Tetrapisispora phaffii CBS 4417]CCE65547.1 hypothetical protein TPHA_0L01950 [Tetrapisispora phaffii CBS 4417]